MVMFKSDLGLSFEVMLMVPLELVFQAAPKVLFETDPEMLCETKVVVSFMSGIRDPGELGAAFRSSLEMFPEPTLSSLLESGSREEFGAGIRRAFEPGLEMLWPRTRVSFE